MIVVVVLKSSTSGHWLRGCHECPLWLPRAARHASHCELFCGRSGWIKPQCPKGFSFPDQNKGLRADRAAPHKSQVGFFVAVREQGEGSCTKQNKAQNAQIAAQSSLVCVQRSRQHKDRPEASQLSQAKLSTIYSLQKLPPNLSTINSQKKQQLPTKLSSPSYFIKSQLPPKSSAPYSGSL